MKPFKAGLYVHFPFCRRKCPYCHFYSIPVEPPADRSRIGSWRNGIVVEAGRFKAGPGSEIGGNPLEFDTLYIGGGTPSLAAPDDFASLRDDLADRLPLRPVEFTLEANLSDGANDDVFRGWIRAGVTRLSVRAQSFDDGVLRILGRSSTASRTESFLRRARDAGFASLGVDLMAGVPGETPRSWDRTIEAVRSIRPEHISLYFLENVEGLPFENILRANPVDDDAAVDAFEDARPLTVEGEPGKRFPLNLQGSLSRESG